MTNDTETLTIPLSEYHNIIALYKAAKETVPYLTHYASLKCCREIKVVKSLETLDKAFHKCNKAWERSA